MSETNPFVEKIAAPYRARISTLNEQLAERDARISELEGDLVGKRQCGAFVAQTGWVCVRENDHIGEHIFLEDIQQKDARIVELKALLTRVPSWLDDVCISEKDIATPEGCAFMAEILSALPNKDANTEGEKG